MKTYGVYQKGLNGRIIISGVSLETAKKHKQEGHVICSERFYSMGLKFQFRVFWRGVKWKFGKSYDMEWFWIGPFCFNIEHIGHMTADKIVEE